MFFFFGKTSKLPSSQTGSTKAFSPSALNGMLKTAEKDKQNPKNKTPHSSYVKLAQSGQSLDDLNLSADFRFQG